PEEADETTADEIRSEIRQWFRLQGSRSAAHKRVRVLRFWNDDFPRTATRKVQRTEVVGILEELLEAEREAAAEHADDDGEWAWLDRILGRVADVPSEEIHAGTHLFDDLGFDSLMFVEAAGILEDNHDITLDADQMSGVETNAQLRELIADHGDSTADEQTTDRTSALVKTGPDSAARRAWNAPPFVRKAGKSLLYRAQMAAYDKFYDVEVYGRAHIPHHNPNVLVAANHCSHLDMGVAKYALGDFGRGLRALAAADYFFEDPLRRSYFQNFTNLIPVERSGSLEEALGHADAAIERGETILIFPEGTRSTDGEIHEFQSGLGYLVDEHDVDVLPMYIDGTYEALPKGQTLPSPLKRNLRVYIGGVLEADELRERIAGAEGRDQFAAISDTTRDEILTLRDRAAGVEGEEDPVAPLFSQLSQDFDPDTANGTEISYYFTLGDMSDLKWSVVVDGDKVRIDRGKPEGGRADCVVKTSPAMFKRIVREGYVPSVDEFMSGDIQTNDPELLRDFQQFFGLS
ncbi:MAG: 1-acyl-sn-glycerol-3-phosphate acyltransferase, partial [Bradymonadaceae bacterium]